MTWWEELVTREELVTWEELVTREELVTWEELVTREELVTWEELEVVAVEGKKSGNKMVTMSSVLPTLSC